MSFRLITVFAAVLLLAACQTAPEEGKSMEGKGAVAAPSGQESMGKEAMTETAVVPGTQADLVANVGDRIFFDFDKSDIRPDQRSRIDSWADWLKKYPQVTVLIEGNCDERGTREYNLALGERRANSAKAYLVAKGISASRIQTISYGKERPAVLGSNEAAWAQNRRDVMVVQ